MKLAALGTTPPGTSTEQQAAQWVRRMFAGIAPRYDFLNHLLSFNIDRLWRRALIDALRPVLREPGARALDLCCGTGDVLLDLKTAFPACVLGADFCHPMLVSARQKTSRKGLAAPLFEADALQLPVAAAAFDAVAIAFGFRNLANYTAGLEECHRILRSGGMLAILEFSHPTGRIMKTLYGGYSRFLLPAIGSLISGSREAYAYLPESIRKFPEPAGLCKMLEAAGFHSAGFQLLTGGIAALHVGVRK